MVSDIKAVINMVCLHRPLADMSWPVTNDQKNQEYKEQMLLLRNINYMVCH